MKTVEIFTAELNGKRIAFSGETVFLVQLASGKGRYQTKHTIKGSLALAVRYYNELRISGRYKKRLLAPAMNKPILMRETAA